MIAAVVIVVGFALIIQVASGSERNFAALGLAVLLALAAGTAIAVLASLPAK